MMITVMSFNKAGSRFELRLKVGVPLGYGPIQIADWDDAYNLSHRLKTITRGRKMFFSS